MARGFRQGQTIHFGAKPHNTATLTAFEGPDHACATYPGDYLNTGEPAQMRGYVFGCLMFLEGKLGMLVEVVAPLSKARGDLRVQGNAHELSFSCKAISGR